MEQQDDSAAGRTERLETRVAELLRAVDELSEIVARQQQQLERQAGQLRLLMEREAARESEGGGGVVLGDERPPHY